MRALASLVAVGVGAYAYVASMDRKTKRRWKKRMTSMDFSMIEELMPNQRMMNQVRRQISKSFS
ncbi:hypothetical protein [Salipaludibacillus daqingensis]|uniref:hypothetical protein n=1 Tax=Salipaludibacillus daqingensis TaxID=3041001 RepID=UPI002473E26B|nr:hypothetical protein [Salipaludibacillus daqingensis]